MRTIMEWTNEEALEFLVLLQSEPCLWNPKVQTHKNRAALNDAWQRIIRSLSFPVTLEQLKKKKESLMGYYRIHINKYKKSLKSGAGPNDLYTTNWFAFDLMDSFLRPIYGTTSAINIESPEDNESADGFSENESNQGPSLSSRNCHSKIEVKPDVNHKNVEIEFVRSDVQNQKNWLKTKTPSETIHVIRSQKRDREQLDEYDHFALMIAAKIRKLQNPDDREVLMNSIQNMVFDCYMKKKKQL